MIKEKFMLTKNDIIECMICKKETKLGSLNKHITNYHKDTTAEEYFLKYLDPDSDPKLTITIADVDCEHFNFAEYRLNKIKEDKGYKNIDFNFEIIEIDTLPTFNNQELDVLLCFEVLEHVPSPIAVINNIKDTMRPGGVYIENFIKHNDEDEDEDGPDLLTAKKERSGYYEIIGENFNLIYPSLQESERNPNCTRSWQKKYL